MRISDWSSDVCSSDLKVKRVTKIAPPSFQVRAGAAFLLFDRSVASRKQDNLDRQAAFIFIIDFHLVPLIALAIVAAMTFWGVLPGRCFCLLAVAENPKFTSEQTHRMIACRERRLQ